MRKVKFVIKIALLVTACLFVLFTEAQQTRRIYFVGNSVTDAMNYGGLQALAESRGNVDKWARLMIPGAPLNYLWESRTSGGFTESPYGNPINAFSVYQWDILSLQPFDRAIEGADGDRVMSANFYNLIRSKSPECMLFIYAHWPRTPSGTTEKTATREQFNSEWLKTTGIETRKFYEDLTTILRNDYQASRDLIRMVPIGEVFYELNNNQAFLEAAGISSIWGVYSDGIHLKGIGSYIVACTMYAMAFHDDPAGLGVPGVFGAIPASAVPLIHQTIKNVILAKSAFTKIDYFGAAPLKSVALNTNKFELNVGKSATLTPRFTPSNAANTKVTWSSSNPLIAEVKDGKVTAAGAGTTEIKVKTDDGGFEAVCSVTVTNSGVAVSGVSVNKNSLSMLVGTEETMVPAIEPATATNKNLFWMSSDPLIAAVDNSGKIKALKKGQATISVTTENGLFTASVAVTVTRPNNPPVAVLKYSPGNSGYAPNKVVFDGRSSYDPDPDDFVLGYDWVIRKVGETTPLRVESSNGFEHTFTQPGDYEITLQAVDNDQQLRSLNVEKVTVKVLEMPAVPADEPALCYEGFDYIKAAITNFNGGRGWGAGWNVQSEKDNTANDFAVDNTTPLVVKNLKQTGNYMKLGQGYSGIGRRLDISSNGPFKDYLDGGKIGKSGKILWFSTVIRPQSNNKDCHISFSDESIAWLNNTEKSHRISFGCFGGNYWSVAFGYGSSQIKHESKMLVVNNVPVFLVAKVEFGSSTKVSLYINPEPGTIPESAAVEATTANSVNFQSVSLNFSNGPNKMAIDEIRFGKSYAEVVPFELKTSVSQLVDDEFRLYPNPAGSQLFIDFSGFSGKTDVMVFDVLGRSVICQLMEQKQSSAIDVSGLKPGFYVVWIRDGEKIRKASFIKQ
jgi:uncharacterized protein YjdB